MREVLFSSRSSKEDTLVGLLDLSIDHPVWGRLIRTALYKDNGIQCKERVNYREDFQVTPKLFYYAKRVSDLDTVIYYYNQNNPLSYLALAKQDERVMLKKRLQDFQSFLLIQDFFKDKENFQGIIEKSAVTDLLNIIQIATRLGDKEHFFEAMQGLKAYPAKYIQEITPRFSFFLIISVLLSAGFSNEFNLSYHNNN